MNFAYDYVVSLVVDRKAGKRLSVSQHSFPRNATSQSYFAALLTL